MIRITDENIEAYRKYYKKKYAIILYDSGIYNEYLTESINKWIDKRLESFKNKDKKLNMAHYISGCANGTKLTSVEIEEKVEMARINPYFKVSLISQYQNNIELKIRLMDLDESKKEELVNKSDELLEKAILHYFSANLSGGLHNYISNAVLKKFFVENEIITNDQQACAVIKARNGDEEARKYLYDKYIDMFSKKSSNNILTKEQQQKFVEYHIKRLIDNYLDNNNGSELSAFIVNTFERRIYNINDKEYMLIKYSMISDEKLEETIEYLIEKYRNIPYIVLSRFGLTNDKRLLAQLTYELKDYVMEYLRYIKKDERCIPCGKYIEGRMKSYLKNKEESEFEFDLDEARYGSLEDREEQLEILRELCEGLKETYKRKNIYYTSEKNVDERIEKCFAAACERYIDNNSTKQAKSYVSTVLGQDMGAYSRMMKKRFYNKKKDDRIYIRTDYIIKQYIMLNNLTEEEAKMFSDYVLFRVNLYINNGCYTEKIDSLLYKIIREYDINKEYEYKKSISKVKIIKPPFNK